MSHTSEVTYLDDAGFVRAPASLVHRRLADLADWPDWWPGCRIHALPSPAGAPTDERFAVELAAGALRRLRLSLRPHSWRPDAGFHLEAGGDIVGAVEFWLDPGYGGTVVHHLAAIAASSVCAERIVAAYRQAVRRGLWGLKDALQLEVRTSAGLTP
ncbi:MAG: SRPBCC family protein [Nitriliruptoraceae bacterium]